MEHFTQLGLSGSPDKKPPVKPLPNAAPERQRPRSDEKRPAGKQRTATLVGSLIATALLGVFVFESGCSKESNKAAAIATPNQNVTNQTPIMPTLATSSSPVASPQPAKEVAAAKVVGFDVHESCLRSLVSLSEV